jgi:hypothetical protein
MQLVNRTGLVAEANLSEDTQGSEQRLLMVTAKATFTFDRAGRVELDSEAPLPLFRSDVPTPLGFLPTDAFPRADPVFEVILLGKAYAAEGRPTEQRRVSLTVGATRRELQVFGDRIWLRREELSQPMPFTEMPLHYERAFGGSFDVLIDAKSKLRISDPSNALGRGFDAETYMKNLGEALRAPTGYPMIPDYIRRAPNVEDPAQLIQHSTDAPTPAGWGAVPTEMGLSVKWALDRIAAQQPATQEEVTTHAYHRAHPDWIIPLPPALSELEMVGVVPYESVRFRLPRLRPVVDILTDAKTYACPLLPQVLVLLPEESRFYLVYKTIVAIAFKPGDDRGLRLRTEERWSDDDQLKDERRS